MTGDTDQTFEEYLRRVHVGPPTVLTGKIVIADYDPTWPDRFTDERSRITDLLGPSALAVEHIGSTSVPGLAAKPIIDIDLIVADSTDEPGYVPVLEAAGYVLRVREPDWYEHRLFKGPDNDVNLHVFSPGVEEHRRHLILRDWLRDHPDDRDRYARTKRELAQRQWKYTTEYADAKSAVIGEILTNAGYVRPGDDLGGS